MTILVIGEAAIRLGEFLDDGGLERGGAIQPLLFFTGRSAGLFGGIGHGEHPAIVEAVGRERLEQHAIGDGHARRISGALDVVKERLSAEKAVAFIKPRIIEDFEKILAVLDHPLPIGELRMEREKIVHRPEPGHIIGSPGVGVGPVFGHDLLIHLGNHFPGGVDLGDHMRSRDFVAQFLADFPRHLQRREHNLRVEAVEAEDSGNGDVALVDPEAVLAARPEINRARFAGHQVVLRVVEGDFPEAFSERSDVALQSDRTLRLRVGKHRQRKPAVGIADGVCRHHQRLLSIQETRRGFC